MKSRVALDHHFPLREKGRAMQVFGWVFAVVGFIWWFYDLVAWLINDLWVWLTQSAGHLSMWWAQSSENPGLWVFAFAVGLGIVGKITAWIGEQS